MPTSTATSEPGESLLIPSPILHHGHWGPCRSLQVASMARHISLALGCKVPAHCMTCPTARGLCWSSWSRRWKCKSTNRSNEDCVKCLEDRGLHACANGDHRWHENKRLRSGHMNQAEWYYERITRMMGQEHGHGHGRSMLGSVPITTSMLSMPCWLNGQKVGTQYIS